MKNILYFQKLFLLPHIRMFILVLFTGMVAATASGMGVPLLIKYVFPVVFYTPGSEMPDLLVKVPSLQEIPRETMLLLACSAMPLVFVIRGFAMWGNAVLVSILGIRILETLRMAVFTRVQELPIAFMESRRKGDVISRITADTTNVQNILTSVANDLVKQPVTAACALGAFIYLLFSSGQGILFLVNLLFVALAAWPIIVFGKRISAKALRSQQGLGELNTAVQQNLENQREIRAYALEEMEISSFSQVSTASALIMLSWSSTRRLWCR